MQEQVDEKTVALSVKATKMTGRALAKAMMFFLKKMRQPSHKTGKQSVKSLSKHGASLVDVPIDGDNIGSFSKIARKYNLDFALKKDITEMPPKWYVFIKTKDNDALKAAMREYGRQEFKYKNHKELRAEQVPIPSEHWKRIGEPVRAASYADPYAWSSTTIGYMLSKPEYMGRKVLGKTVSESYKKHKSRKTNPDEQHVFDGAYPAIIDEETWNNVQRLRETKRRAPKQKKEPHMLTGLLYCADCNSKMTHRSNTISGRWQEDSFICGSYRQLTRDCTMHYISSKNVIKIVLTAIQRVSWYVREHEADFIKEVRKAYKVQQEETVKDSKKQLAQSKKRFSELDMLIKKLYKTHALGKLPDKHFERILSEYDVEQSALETSMAEFQAQIDSWQEDNLKTDMFIELAKRYTDFTELTAPMLNEFVERIVVHEGEGRGKNRRMRVDVHFSFIGDFSVPSKLVTPMEKAEQKHLQKEVTAKKKLLQELSRERYEQRKAEKREFTARKKAGLLTPEEVKADEQRRKRNREWQKQWRDKKAAEQQPKPAVQSDNRRGKSLTDDAMPLPAGI